VAIEATFLALFLNADLWAGTVLVDEFDAGALQSGSNSQTVSAAT
jgi:hypothetical protein